MNRLADDFSRAKSVKEAARIRSQCSLDEWKMVLNEARRIYNRRRQYRAVSV